MDLADFRGGGGGGIREVSLQSNNLLIVNRISNPTLDRARMGSV